MCSRPARLIAAVGVIALPPARSACTIFALSRGRYCPHASAAAASSRAHAPAGGRVVLNHSTHVEGLIPLLRRVAQLPGVHTVVPGRLSTARCATQGLALRVTTRVPGGYKLLARRGTAVQEVFVTVDRGGGLAAPPATAADSGGGSECVGDDDDAALAAFGRAIDGVASMPTRGGSD